MLQVITTDIIETAEYKHFNSHEWPLQHTYNIKQGSNENKEKYQSGDYY